MHKHANGVNCIHMLHLFASQGAQVADADFATVDTGEKESGEKEEREREKKEKKKKVDLLLPSAWVDFTSNPNVIQSACSLPCCRQLFSPH